MRAESPDERWLKLQSEGGRLREQGKYEEARRAYEDALRIAEASGTADKLAQTLNNLAASCYDGGHYNEAESYYRRALDIWKPDQSTEGRRTQASVWGNLAALYAATARAGQAESLYLQAIELADQPDEESIALRTTLIGDLAGVYLKQGRPREAEPLLMRAL
ncbi:MAG: tetratricopeptide repeat protein, partial [Bryobacteraceae bacterium]